MALRLENPLAKVGVFMKRRWKASLRLWAGSVETMRTEKMRGFESGTSFAEWKG